MPDVFYNDAGGQRKRVAAEAHGCISPLSPFAPTVAASKEETFRGAKFGLFESKAQSDADSDSLDGDERYAIEIQKEEKTKYKARLCKEENEWFKALVEEEGTCELCGEHTGVERIVALVNCEHHFCR